MKLEKQQLSCRDFPNIASKHLRDFVCDDLSAKVKRAAYWLPNASPGTHGFLFGEARGLLAASVNSLGESISTPELTSERSEVGTAIYARTPSFSSIKLPSGTVENRYRHPIRIAGVIPYGLLEVVFDDQTNSDLRWAEKCCGKVIGKLTRAVLEHMEHFKLEYSSVIETAGFAGHPRWRTTLRYACRWMRQIMPHVKSVLYCERVRGQNLYAVSESSPEIDPAYRRANEQLFKFGSASGVIGYAALKGQTIRISAGAIERLRPHAEQNEREQWKQGPSGQRWKPVEINSKTFKWMESKWAIMVVPVYLSAPSTELPDAVMAFARDVGEVPGYEMFYPCEEMAAAEAAGKLGRIIAQQRLESDLRSALEFFSTMYGLTNEESRAFHEYVSNCTITEQAAFRKGFQSLIIKSRQLSEATSALEAVNLPPDIRRWIKR
jgi:hypothetical protein